MAVDYKSSFDVEKFYKDAENGLECNLDAFRMYLESFSEVIVWGAGNLGTALGKGLIERKCKLSLYWDRNYSEIGYKNGIPVEEPFSGDHNPEKTLVIIGIVNGTLSHTWQKSVLEGHGYKNYLLGMPTYEAIVCPLAISKPFDIRECVGTSICNFNTCHKYMNILGKDRHKTGLSIHVLEIIVSARCTLDCKFCGQQAGETKRKFPEKYKDYPLEEIKKSIDSIMDRVDMVGTFSVIGGEPFIHPNIVEILEHCLSKDNVGIISITSNGIFKLTDDLMKVLKNDRIKINLSNYTSFLNQEMKALFEENVRKLLDQGIACNTGTPIWSTLSDELKPNPDYSDEHLDKRRGICVFGPSVAGQYMYACPQTERMARMEVHDMSEDTIDLREDTDNLTERIRIMLEKTHYNSCRYMCSNGIDTTIIPAGEQWEDSRIDRSE